MSEMKSSMDKMSRKQLVDGSCVHLRSSNKATMMRL